MANDDRVRIFTLLYVKFYFPYIIAPVGMLGNLVAMIILARGKCGLTRCITHYLIAMAAADLLVVFSNAAIVIIFNAVYSWMPHTVACTLQNVMAFASFDCSVWLTVAFTFDRFVAICYQKFKIKYCTVRTARIAIGTVYALSLLRNIPYYFAFESFELYAPVGCAEKLEYYYLPGWLAFSWLHNILTPLLPFFVILLLNILTVRSILVASRARRKLRAHVSGERKEDPEMESRMKSIVLLFCVSGSFILLWLTEVTVFIHSHVGNIHVYPSWAHPMFMAFSAGDMLKILSSCTNTFIYILTQSKIREELRNAIKYPFTKLLGVATQ